MNQVKDLLEDNMAETMVRAVVSNPRRSLETKKISFHPFMEKGYLMFQREEYRNNQVFHHNMDKEAAVLQICHMLERDYKQLDVQCQDCSYSVLVSKKGKSTIKRRQTQEIKRIDLSHNRKKKYILDTGEVIPFLVDLGVQTSEGKIVDKKYKKFRQINRFLEFVRDVLPELKKQETQGRPLRIIDFGCGKSYLTFAMYYYLKIINGLQVEMTGLDLKTDVICHCNRLAEKYGYENLHFSQGDISTYEGDGTVDMVITLHACDTATDYALYQAVSWNASVILSVPCCQHEMNQQIKNEVLEPMLKHGILKERFSALLTDALRSQLLEMQGYDVQILEFVDMEHTPKNLLIRAVKSPASNKDKTGSSQAQLREQQKKQYQQLCQAYNSHGTLESLLEGSL